MTDQNDPETPTDCLTGPLETHGDLLVLRIPLVNGWDKFINATAKIAAVDGDVLEVASQYG